VRERERERETERGGGGCGRMEERKGRKDESGVQNAGRKTEKADCGGEEWGEGEGRVSGEGRG
jgi:hypothetical protein